MLDSAQILAVHDIGAVFVFHDREQLARPASFFDQIDLVRRRMPLHTTAFRQARLLHLSLEVKVIEPNNTGGILCCITYLVVLSAGIGTGALVWITVIEVSREQAPA